jgi:hypothetical protein
MRRRRWVLLLALQLAVLCLPSAVCCVFLSSSLFSLTCFCASPISFFCVLSRRSYVLAPPPFFYGHLCSVFCVCVCVPLFL